MAINDFDEIAYQVHVEGVEQDEPYQPNEDDNNND